jgi:SAM-dependent methyltransferase
MVGYYASVRVFEDQEQQNLRTDGIEGSGIGANYDAMIERYLADDKIHWTHFLSVEDDMGFAPDVLHQLLRRDVDIVGANYCCNKGSPLWFTARKGSETVLTTEESTGLEEVDLMPQGLTLVRREVYEKIKPPRFLTGWSPNSGKYVSQDYYFSEQAREAGYKLYVDHDVSKLIFHVGPKQYSYLDALADERREKPTKKALDVGAGRTRRRWPDHETVTTDIRMGIADVTTDSCKLPFEDASFDLVASNHHLEHIPRCQQDIVWGEMFRVLKPGGRMEHTIPSLDWAAKELSNGGITVDVLNVLYGAQEQDGYARDLNTHYFGYTRKTAEEMAAKAGLVDVTCRDWRDDEQMRYHLLVTGVKP